ncbi:tetratricopeptide repeat protein [Maribacter algarum]|uniref:Tetratricopeptide repeat protein n=1 Tax=Maribacter algarum (ex Zhang et al. 2020) TaxID=2578118 RepID=A0A5S3PR78_9FLAO|nr:tetratricopeptide repeat protein [Maribacter algarum]TMM57240.1 tetratricopeptide repeat protein [Maribacter algarum]
MKSKRFCFPLFMLSFAVIQSQDQTRVDSLLKLYENETTIEEKVHLLDELDEIYIYTKPDSAKVYVDEMLKISKEGEYKHGILRAEFLLGHYYSTLGQMDVGAEYYRKTLERSIKDDDDTFLATVLKNLSIYESHIGNYPEAIRLMDSSATIQKEWGDFMRYGSALNVIGKNYYDMGNYPKAMEMYQAALKTMDTIQIKTYHKADVLGNIGSLHSIQKSYDQALKYFEMAMEVYMATDDNLYQATTLVDIGNVLDSQKEYDLAIDSYKKGLAISEKYDFPTIKVLCLGNLGSIYKEQGKYDEAIKHLKQALQMKDAENSGINKANYLAELGYTYALKGDFDNGFDKLNTAVDLADSIKVGNELQAALQYRALAYEKNGELQNSVRDLKRSQKVKDSLFSLAKAKQIDELQTSYETEKKESEIALQQFEINTLNEKAKVDKLTKGLYAGGMFTFLTVSGLLFFSFRQRMKKNRIEREKQEEIYKQEIEHKKKELASQTLHLVQKNTFIQELMENLENIKNSPEKFKMEFRRIVMLLKKENASDKDWEVFKTYFAEVHNDFDQKLKTLYTDISEKEIRLAAFLRMNLTTKEIAATLNVLPDSILKSKYRLKKKLNLDKETDLTSFLNTL